MNCLMSSFVEQILQLNKKGLSLTHHETGHNMIFKLIPIAACVDSVARPILQNHFQFNGYYGCSWCYIYGKYMCGTVRYPLSETNDELRTHNTNLEDTKHSIMLQKSIRGVKGSSELMRLPFFDTIWGYPVEYMHGISLGVAKQLWELWTSGESEFHLNIEDRKEISRRLELIRVPHEIHRLPRSLADKGKWKASEWRSWCIFYSPVCLNGVLNDRAYVSFLLFSRSIYTLLKLEITTDELRQCELDLLKFTGECEILYGNRAPTFNVHSLLHLVDSVRKTGPLWSSSTFHFENGIRICKNYVNGPNNVGYQIVTKWSRANHYRSCVKKVSINNACIHFCNNLFAAELLTNDYVRKSNDCHTVLIGAPKTLENVTKKVRAFLHNDTAIVQVFDRCIHKNVVVHSLKYIRVEKTNDTVVLLNNGSIVQIEYITIIEGKCYILAAKLCTTSMNNPIELNHIKKIVRKDKVLSVFDISAIEKKVLLMDLGSAGEYICFLPNLWETQ